MLDILIFLMALLPARASESAHFPKNFNWCVATAAYQVEGNDSNSDWWDWEKVSGHIKNGEKSGLTVDEWNRLPEDIGLMKNLGINTYRFSVEWAKIEPEEGRFDSDAIKHYQMEVAELKQAGIMPFITLHHFTMPRWLSAKGGWEWDGSTEAFAKFTELVYTQIAPGVHDWVTINEPMVYTFEGYLSGEMPPGEKRPISGTIPVILGLLKAHARAYHVLHDLAKKMGHEVRVGMANHLRTFDAYNPYNPLDRFTAYFIDQIWNWAIPDALESGRYKIFMPFAVSVDSPIPGLKGTQDYFGINYYTGDLVQFSLSKGFIPRTRNGFPKTDLGWDIYPDGFRILLHEVATRYKDKPVVVTENGIGDAKDSNRPRYIIDHLRVLAEAMKAGVPVKGYCHWTLMDNFEWNEGTPARFGLYSINPGTLARLPRPISTKLFQDIISSGTVPSL